MANVFANAKKTSNPHRQRGPDKLIFLLHRIE
jgi:hypothetical protein